MKILYFAQLKESIGKDEDIIDFSSYEKGKKILKKYKVNF